MIGICVKTNGSFTLFDEYEINFDSDSITALSDDGCHWFLFDQGDGYCGCRDESGKEVIFLVEQHFLLKLKSKDGLY